MSHIESLKEMESKLISCSKNQLDDISKADANELGEAIDMIKDLSEAIYYCTITESMEKSEEKEYQGDTNINYYTTPSMNSRMYPDYRDMERSGGYMYYPTGGNSGGNTEMPSVMGRDPREGRSPMRRRMYMEGKEMHNDTNSQLQELEAYLKELSTDITEMIKDASQEEKATLREKMTMLANKIA